MPSITAFGQTSVVRLTKAPADKGFVEVAFASGATLQVQPQHLDGVHRVGDMDTAVAAGRGHLNRAERLTDAQIEVLAALSAAGANGMTDDQHEMINGLRGDSAGKRRLELAGMGYVTSTAERRPTRRGKLAAVWRITQAGQGALDRARAHVTAS